jgi:hypothetical protein
VRIIPDQTDIADYTAAIECLDPTDNFIRIKGVSTILIYNWNLYLKIFNQVIRATLKERAGLKPAPCLYSLLRLQAHPALRSDWVTDHCPASN